MVDATRGKLEANAGDLPPPSSGTAVVKLSSATGASPREVMTAAPVPSLELQLEQALLLVTYAAEAGIDVGEKLRRDVLGAKAATASGWTEETANQLLGALTQLTVLLSPVSGESLLKCTGKEASATITLYRWVAIILGAIIVPFSVAAFVASATCETIHKDIDLANALAVTLGEKISPAFGAPVRSESAAMGEARRPFGGDELKELQQFASTMRDINARARRLSFFGRRAVSDEDTVRFELPPEITNFSTTTAEAIRAYQRVRYFAQSIQETVLTSFGAVTACILPVLYALLGACAYLIRSFEGQIKASTFTGNEKPTAHFLVAAIGGFVVGLFGDFGTGQGEVLPPLAMAFLVGYGVDVFFYFLDRLLQTFGRPQPSAPAPARARGGE